MSYYSTHQFKNGAVVTAERVDNRSEISIRIQGEGENMLADLVCDELTAICIAHSILSVIVKDVE